MQMIPDKLYKYRCFDNNGYYRDLLEKNALYFASPLKFNDPFDCRVVPNYESGSKKDLYKKMYQVNKMDNPHLSHKVLKQLTNKDFNENYKILKNQELYNQRKLDTIDKMIGIFTLTEKNDNLLMWSHYSDSHFGFCVEFDTKKLFDICDNYVEINEYIAHKKVSYSSKYPQIDPYVNDTKYDWYTIWLTLKSNHWEYEQEWRLIYSEHPNELVEFPDDIITGIYFGVNCVEDKMQKVIELTKSRKNPLKYYKAKLRRNEFGIDFVLI